MGDVGYRTACSECGHLHCCIDYSGYRPTDSYFLPCRECDCELRPAIDHHNPAWEFAKIWTDGEEGPHEWGTPANPRVTPEVIPLVSAPGSALRRYSAGGSGIEKP